MKNLLQYYLRKQHIQWRKNQTGKEKLNVKTLAFYLALGKYQLYAVVSQSLVRTFQNTIMYSFSFLGVPLNFSYFKKLKPKTTSIENESFQAFLANSSTHRLLTNITTKNGLSFQFTMRINTNTLLR